MASAVPWASCLALCAAHSCGREAPHAVCGGVRGRGPRPTPAHVTSVVGQGDVGHGPGVRTIAWYHVAEVTSFDSWKITGPRSTGESQAAGRGRIRNLGPGMNVIRQCPPLLTREGHATGVPARAAGASCSLGCIRPRSSSSSCTKLSLRGQGSWLSPAFTERLVALAAHGDRRCSPSHAHEAFQRDSVPPVLNTLSWRVHNLHTELHETTFPPAPA